MRFSAFFCLLLLACLYLSLAQGSYENCCLRYVDIVKRSTKRNVITYRIQQTDGGCNVPAIVFTLRRGTAFCADPNQRWVKLLMKRVDKRKALTS
ncbi:C-C motif chemokine 25b [Megalops cyprinoides]|uniref:C-C motif chemokine 25b n=1 Tax=Megalops cyprinoides TaxID=118141 RepID=UPI00186523B6|nr:C-C motif chemokine 25b [Megalops cyprinoides]